MTLELSIYALTIATIGGLVLGIVAASRRNSSVDVVVMAGANVGVSIPIFVLGLLLVFVFAISSKDTPFALPPSGASRRVLDRAARGALGLEDQQGPVRTFVDFVSNMYTLNGLLSAQWNIFSDAFRHLILRRSRWPRSRSPSSPASRARACSTCSASTTFGLPERRASRKGTCCAGTPSEMPRCRS
jgi:ABC-type dipeptide/oligopeptide/nickel transport system permease component